MIKVYSQVQRPHIDIRRDKVIIENTEVPRPPAVSPSQWLEFWERAIKIKIVLANRRQI